MDKSTFSIPVQLPHRVEPSAVLEHVLRDESATWSTDGRAQGAALARVTCPSDDAPRVLRKIREWNDVAGLVPAHRY